MAASPEGMDHLDASYALEEEMELLEAIYIHELSLEGPRERPTAVSVLLHPSTGDEEHKRFVCLTLVINLPDKYPLELPSIHIKTPRGLSEAHIESILENLRELAEGCLGRPMLYELIEYAKESLTDNNTPSCACAICLCHFQDNHDFTKTECYHYFHCGCLARYIEFSLQQEKEDEDSTKVECPMCRLPITYNLAELRAVAYSEENEEEIVYKPSAEIRKLQKKMSSLFEKQKRKGGVIDIEQERNRFLIDITSVRQEETIPESEPPTGAVIDTVTKNPITEPTVNNAPKREDTKKEASLTDNVSRKDKTDKKDKKEFSKYSGPSRGPRQPVVKTGNLAGEGKYRQNQQRRTENKRFTPSDRPKSAEQRGKDKDSVKELSGSDFALLADAKPKSTQSGLESQKNTSVVNPPGKSEKEASTNCNFSQNSNEERPRSARRGRGRSGRGRPSSGGTNKSRENVNKSRTTGDAVKQPSVAKSSENSKPQIAKNDGLQDQSKTPARSSENESLHRPPPGFKTLKAGKGGCEQSANANSHPPPGFEHSTRPRPPPGFGNQAEGLTNK